MSIALQFITSVSRLRPATCSRSRDVKAVNPVTKATQNYLQQFVVTCGGWRHRYRDRDDHASDHHVGRVPDRLCGSDRLVCVTFVGGATVYGSEPHLPQERLCSVVAPMVKPSGCG
jgi:hypothetical protein